MKNMKIRVKLLVGFGCILALLIILNAFSIIRMRKNSNMAKDLYSGPYLNSVSSVSLMREMYQMDSSLKSMVLEGDPNSYASAYQDARARADQEMNAIRNAGSYDTSALTALQDALGKIDASYQTAVGYLGAGALDKAEAEVSAVYGSAISSAAAAAEQLAASADKASRQYIDETVSLTNNSIIFQDILFAVIFIFSIMTALKMSVDFVLPIRELGAGMKDVSTGKFDIQLNNNSQDELGALSQQLSQTVENIKAYIKDITYVLGEISRGNIDLKVDREYVGEFNEIKGSMNLILDSLNDTIRQIETCCEQVRTGAVNLANSSQSLAQGSSEQTVAIEDFQRSLDLVADLTKQDGENASKVRNMSENAIQVVTESNQQMKGLLNAMEEIDESSREIAKIIKIIEEISSQTNILALNASVEAARAGAAGKGFAVVADEVRNLASKSAQAAGSTSSMIDKAVRAVDGGVRMAKSTAQSLDKVENYVGSMSSFLKKIDQSTQEQISAFDNILSTMDLMTSVVQSNSSAAEENSAASEELAAQSKILEELVNRFQVRAANGNRIA